MQAVGWLLLSNFTVSRMMINLQLGKKAASVSLNLQGRCGQSRSSSKMNDWKEEETLNSALTAGKAKPHWSKSQHINTIRKQRGLK